MRINNLFTVLLVAFLAIPDVSHAQDEGSLSDTLEISGSTVKAVMTKTTLTGNSIKTTVRGTALAKSGSAYEMLAKVPGMTKKDDGPEVIGRGKPVYYINGRKVQDTEELKRLHSDEIQNVEVIVNPGAVYDAAVSSVVRIRTIRQQGEGFGFDFSARNNQNLVNGYSDPGATANLKYRFKSVDVFSMLNYWEWDGVDTSHPVQNTYIMKDGGLTNIFQETYRKGHNSSSGLNANMGFNWQISQDHSVGMRLERNYSLSSTSYYRAENMIRIHDMSDSSEDSEDETVSEGYAPTSIPYSWSGNAYYNGRAGMLGIDLNMDFLTNRENMDTDISEDKTSGTDYMNQLNSTCSDMYAAKLVLSYPVWKGMIEAGTEMTHVSRQSRFSISGYPLPATDTDVKENNVAGFVQYSFTTPALGSFNAGLRYEHVGFDYADALNPDKSMSRYTDEFFPSLSWTRQFGDFQTSFAYSVKTIRPGYRMLDESINYLNSYSFEQGNLKFRNALQQETSIGTRWKWLNVFMAYERRDHAHTQWSELYNDDGVMLVRYVNLPVPVRNLATFVSASPTFGCYSPNWTMGVQRFWYRQTLADPSHPSGQREIEARRPVFFCNLNNTFRFRKSLQFEADLNVTSKGDVMNYKLKAASYNLYLALQKCWLENDALCLRISVSDVLQKRVTKVIIDCGYYVLDQESRPDYHSLEVSLRYSFNASRNRYKGTGAGKDIQSRL